MTKEKTKSKFIWDVFDIAEIFIVCTAIIVVMFSLVLRMTQVSGVSMQDTLQDKEYLLVSKLFYTPERGDIVVVHDPNKASFGGDYGKPLVKRVIGLPGDTIAVNDGNIYINGKILSNEDYIKASGSNAADPYKYSYYNGQKWTVGENEVFVMGDNRSNSGDSRIFGPVDIRCVVGKALVRVYPVSKFSFFKDPVYSEY